MNNIMPLGSENEATVRHCLSVKSSSIGVQDFEPAARALGLDSFTSWFRGWDFRKSTVWRARVYHLHCKGFGGVGCAFSVQGRACLQVRSILPARGGGSLADP